jgi:hypothetical protein
VADSDLVLGQEIDNPSLATFAEEMIVKSRKVVWFGPGDKTEKKAGNEKVVWFKSHDQQEIRFCIMVSNPDVSDGCILRPTYTYLIDENRWVEGLGCITFN